ncbi:TBC1 domain family member 5-like [Clavelina lepadiformis]|uniref:TBC1 domain family member 5-like n=1 Tax=Clavelina lepadiformis TaxID=159417 RepID=UPI00404206CD
MLATVPLNPDTHGPQRKSSQSSIKHDQIDKSPVAKDVKAEEFEKNNLERGDVQSNTITSYLAQWTTYFQTENNASDTLLAKLRNKAFTESLRSCHFRSVCWRVFLGCLPEDVKQWEDIIHKSRQAYGKIKLRHVTNPHSSESDVQLENPLSQSDNSTWLQYFKNNELKNIIERDVTRTCPEMDFFRSPAVREILRNVLFCYARENDSLCYRQGMHELLGPLVFVLHCDLQGAAHAREIGTLPDIISLLLDEDYLEHDAYLMFCQVMNATNEWYSVSCKSKVEAERDDGDTAEKAATPALPFQPVDNNVGSAPLAITNKLTRIHDKLLAHFDLELYHHISRLEIIPQVYGLRWVRLLFGREFDLQDLLVLWDALFADSSSLDLVDYIFVAMMHNIRHRLLAADYCKCMQLLMKYPPIEDIYDLVHLAMHYRDPKNHPMPQHRFRAQLKVSTVQQQTEEKVVDKKNKMNFLTNIKFDNPFDKFKKGIASATKTKKSNISPYMASERKVVQKKEDNSDKPNKTHEPKYSRMHSISGSDEMSAQHVEFLHQKEIETVKKQLHDLHDKCSFCSEKLDINIKVLQKHLSVKTSRTNSTTDDISNAEKQGSSSTITLSAEEDTALVALANLKQIRDILKGVLNVKEHAGNDNNLQSTLDNFPTPPSHTPDEVEDNKLEKETDMSEKQPRKESWTVVEDLDNPN